MSTIKTDLTDRQLEVYEEYLKSGGKEKETAEKLNISITNLRKTLYYCARKGKHITPDTFCPDAPAGFGMFLTTIHSKDGKIVERWDRARPMGANLDAAIEYLSHRTPINSFTARPPIGFDHQTMLEWTLADLHFGMHAWGRESGEDYDIKIARELVLDSGSDIFSRSGKVKRATLVLTGDNIHSDFKSNHTEKSGHPLDVDGRYNKVVETAIDVFLTVIEMTMQYAEEVHVIVMYGNHDGHSSVWLQYLLHFSFRHDARVKVDLSPAKERFNFWGCSGFIYHHGDGTKPERICSDLMQHIAMNDIQGVRFFHAKQGHLHKEEIKDINGVTFEYIPSPVARDCFASGASYRSKRATVATIFHSEIGECDRYTITPFGLKRKAEMALIKGTA